jgi:hypothetical protein
MRKAGEKQGEVISSLDSSICKETMRGPRLQRSCGGGEAEHVNAITSS